MTIDYEVDETTPEVEAHLDEVIAEEARKFTAAITDRLEAEGIEDVQIVRMDESES
jgi:hypothetical protein